MKIALIWTCMMMLVLSMMDPSSIYKTLKMSITDDLQLITVDIGRTVNGRTISAYGITKEIQEISHPPTISQLKNYNSILVSSYFNPKDQNGVDLSISIMDFLIKIHKSDYYLSYVLSHGIFWIVPFLNIDGYEILIRNQENSQKLKDWGKLIKNYNKANLQDDQKCQKDSYGINIDANFMQPINKVNDPCSIDYAGPLPFSQAQSKAIKYMYSLFRITTAINIEGFGNKWVYPYTYLENNEKLQKNFLYFMYNDIRTKLLKQNYVIGTYKELFRKTKNGGYVDWAIQQGTLAFTYYYGTQFNTPKNILDSHSKNSYAVFDMLIKKNSPVFNKYRNAQNSRLYIESICLINIVMKIEVIQATQSISRVYKILPGQLLQVNFQSYLLIHKFDSEIEVSIEGTILKERFNLQSLNIIDGQKTIKISSTETFHSRMIIFIVILVGVVLIAGYRYYIAHKKRFQFVELRNQE